MMCSFSHNNAAYVGCDSRCLYYLGMEHSLTGRALSIVC